MQRFGLSFSYLVFGVVLLVFDVVAGVWCYWCLYSFCSVLSVVVVNVSFGVAVGVTYFVAYCLKNNCSAF